MSAELLVLIETILGSSFVIPPIIEFVSYKIHGIWKILLMFLISILVVLFTQWQEGIIQIVNWKDIPSVLTWAGVLCTGMALTWNNIWKKGINPFLKKRKNTD